jgi:hypothetical protein
MQWYYTVQGQRQGPVDDAGLEDLVRQGVIRDDTYVWREGLAEWQLYGAVKPKPMPAPTPAPPARPIDNPPMEGFGASPSPGSYAERPYVPPAATARPAATAKPAAAGSDGVLFYYPVLRAMGDGRVIRTCVTWALKIGAFVVVLGGLLSAFGAFAASQGAGGGGMLGAVLLGVILLGTSMCVGQIFWYRAGSVAALSESEYTLIPITSILCRLGGECGATGFAGLAAGAFLFLLLNTGGPDLRNLPIPVSLPISGGFVGALLALVYFGALALVSLISGYFAAEWIGVLVDIAESIHKIRRVAEKAQ